MGAGQTHTSGFKINCFKCFSSAGTPINKRPVLGYKNLNLFKLYRLVHRLGGFDGVSPPPTVAPSLLEH